MEVQHLKLTITKSKNAACFYVQRSVRRGRPTFLPHTVEKLGNLEAMGRGQTAGIPYQWAKELCRGTEQEGIRGKKEIIISYSPAKLLNRNERMAFNCGYLFLQEIYNGLGLDRICAKIARKRKFQYDLNEILSRLVYTRIIYPTSKLGTWKFSGASLSHLLRAT